MIKKRKIKITRRNWNVQKCLELWFEPFLRTCNQVATIFLWWLRRSRHQAERLWMDSCESFRPWSFFSNRSTSNSELAMANWTSNTWDAVHARHSTDKRIQPSGVTSFSKSEDQFESERNEQKISPTKFATTISDAERGRAHAGVLGGAARRGSHDRQFNFAQVGRWGRVPVKTSWRF